MDLIEKILKEGHSFSFFQIIRILRRLLSGSTGKLKGKGVSGEALRIRPDLSLAFPASDVKSVQNKGDLNDPNFLIHVNFLGLYGSSSPLPVFYTEDLLDEKADDESAARDFIDIINQRIFSLLFEAWSKYRLYLKVEEEKDTQHINRLFCLLGLGEESFRRNMHNPYELLRYTGLLTQYPRSGMGLKILLSDALGIQVAVIPCIQRTVKIPEDQRSQLGIRDGSRLGLDTYLGEYLEDRMGKFRLQLGPLSVDDFRNFSPGADKFKRLRSLTEFYFSDPLEFDIELIIARGVAQTICLGDPCRSTLGIDTWIFSEKTLGEMRIVYSLQN